MWGRPLMRADRRYAHACMEVRMAKLWKGVLGAAPLMIMVACSATPATGPIPSPTLSSRSGAHSGGAPVWPPIANSDLPGDRESKLQSEITRWVDAGLIPGVTAAVATPQGVWSGSAGIDGRGTPLEPNSGFAVASITKTFTAAEVMLLADRGDVDLDKAASAYLAIPQVANGVTIRQLLAQRSGVAESREAPLGDPDVGWSTARYLTFVPVATAKPGATFAYDNTNYVLLGLVVEKVTGRTVAEALHADLWAPLGLSRLAYQDAQRLAPPLARPPLSAAAEAGVRGCTGAGAFLPCRALATVFGAAGGVAGDAESVARWGYALYGSRVLRAESVAQMTDFTDGDGYGLGTWDLNAVGNGRWNVDGVGHTGESVGYRSVMAVFRDAKVSVAIMTPSEVEVLPLVQYLVKAGSPLS